MKNSFFEKVHKAVQKIPKGKVATYGQIAQIAGSPRAFRAVGMCMRNNPDTKITPCHRVVASDGSLTGYAYGGVSKKKELLMKEGVKFKGDKVDLTISQMK
jgi:methylated-DNA-protein-cysteine methyltransferase-like protein